MRGISEMGARLSEGYRLGKWLEEIELANPMTESHAVNRLTIAGRLRPSDSSRQLLKPDILLIAFAVIYKIPATITEPVYCCRN